MDYEVISYVAFGVLAVYIAIRLFGQRTVNKLVQDELNHVMNSDEHKVKGRYE